MLAVRVAVADNDGEIERVRDGVADAVGDSDALGVGDALGVDMLLGVSLCVWEAVAVTVRLDDWLGVPDGEPVCVWLPVSVGDAETLWLAD